MTKSPVNLPCLEDDMQQWEKERLHKWAMWRISINEQLIGRLGEDTLKDVLYSDKPQVEEMDRVSAKQLYGSSTTLSSVLGDRIFYMYGVPRAIIGPTDKDPEMGDKLDNRQDESDDIPSDFAALQTLRELGEYLDDQEREMEQTRATREIARNNEIRDIRGHSERDQGQEQLGARKHVMARYNDHRQEKFKSVQDLSARENERVNNFQSAGIYPSRVLRQIEEIESQDEGHHNSKDKYYPPQNVHGRGLENREIAFPGQRRRLPRSPQDYRAEIEAGRMRRWMSAPLVTTQGTQEGRSLSPLRLADAPRQHGHIQPQWPGEQTKYGNRPPMSRQEKAEDSEDRSRAFLISNPPQRPHWRHDIHANGTQANDDDLRTRNHSRELHDRQDITRQGITRQDLNGNRKSPKELGPITIDVGSHSSSGNYSGSAPDGDLYNFDNGFQDEGVRPDYDWSEAGDDHVRPDYL